MPTSKKEFPINFQSIFSNVNPVSKFIFISLGLGLLMFVVFRTRVVNYFYPTQIILAAGDKQGESHIISEAIKKVVEEKDKTIKINILTTGGTSENLKFLEEGRVQLATAQADVAVGEVNILSNNEKNQSSKPKPIALPETIAILFEDYFQLVVKDSNINNVGQLRNKRIALPSKGGQYKSFLKIAEHYGLLKSGTNKLDVIITGEGQSSYKDQQAEEDFINNKADAIFRVRALGNQGISNLVQNYGGKLLPIDQASAMKIKFPAFEPGKIPQGAYKGTPPVPDKDLETVVVARLLLSSDKVDKDIIQRITEIIIENPQQMANAIDTLEENYNKSSREYDVLKSLISGIRDPRNNDNRQIPIPIHPGAFAYYERDKDFIKENADYLSLIWGIFVVLLPLGLQFKSSWEQHRKDAADIYINSAIKLMKDDDQIDLDKRQVELDNIFNEAAQALILEDISQESFRTFNEAYKTSRETIERDKLLAQRQTEKEQTENSAKYIEEVLNLLQNDNNLSREILYLKLDKILKQVASDLVKRTISQESFRTFIEAYKTTKDAIDSNAKFI
ncbi:MAG: TAXI family TRAP transporter solute-binding subunit [Calothrix sp. SM1_7_51]|nr:TAXI family TRAP transporter solute-binding subunit [Calothrix sp. SM1_7_51]